MFEELNKSEIEKVIKKNNVGRLACCDDGKTYVVPISYAYDGKYIYARTFEGMKIKMMRKNPKVCFQIDEMEDMANWESVVVWGDFEELTDRRERDKALKILVSRILPTLSSKMARLSPEWPFPTKDYKEIQGIVFRIKLEEKTGRRERMEPELYWK